MVVVGGGRRDGEFVKERIGCLDVHLVKVRDALRSIGRDAMAPP